jgi:hypothetical protein
MLVREMGLAVEAPVVDVEIRERGSRTETQELVRMLRRYMGFLALSAVPAAALAIAACSSDSDDADTTPDAGGVEAGVVDDEGIGRVPPAPPTEPPSAGDTPTAIAIRRLHLGDTDRAGNPSTQAWREFGYNLDGRLSTKDSTEHCQPQPGGIASQVKTDGVDGIDNAFGASLMKILTSFAADASTQINQAITDGGFTIIIDMGLGPEAENTATEIVTKMHPGAEFGSLLDCTATPSEPNCSPPKFDGTDTWPLAPIGETTEPITVMFPSSYITDGTWVSGSTGTLDLVISMLGFEFTLSVIEAVITMKVNGRGTSATATDGVIAGVVDTEQLVGELRKLAGSIAPNLCQGDVFEALAKQVRGSSDIMKDGSNGDSSRACDAISVGMGFEGTAVTLGGVAPRAEPPPDPCAATP